MKDKDTKLLTEAYYAIQEQTPADRFATANRRPGTVAPKPKPPAPTTASQVPGTPTPARYGVQSRNPLNPKFWKKTPTAAPAPAAAAMAGKSNAAALNPATYGHGAQAGTSGKGYPAAAKPPVNNAQVNRARNWRQNTGSFKGATPKPSTTTAPSAPATATSSVPATAKPEKKGLFATMADRLFKAKQGQGWTPTPGTDASYGRWNKWTGSPRKTFTGDPGKTGGPPDSATAPDKPFVDPTRPDTPKPPAETVKPQPVDPFAGTAPKRPGETDQQYRDRVAKKAHADMPDPIAAAAAGQPRYGTKAHADMPDPIAAAAAGQPRYGTSPTTDTFTPTLVPPPEAAVKPEFEPVTDFDQMTAGVKKPGQPRGAEVSSPPTDTARYLPPGSSPFDTDEGDITKDIKAQQKGIDTAQKDFRGQSLDPKALKMANEIEALNKKARTPEEDQKRKELLSQYAQAYPQYTGSQGYAQ